MGSTSSVARAGGWLSGSATSSAIASVRASRAAAGLLARQREIIGGAVDTAVRDNRGHQSERGHIKGRIPHPNIVRSDRRSKRTDDFVGVPLLNDDASSVRHTGIER